MYQQAYYEAYKERILIRNRAYYAKNSAYIIARKNDASISRKLNKDPPISQKLKKKQKEGSPKKEKNPLSHKYYKPEASNTFKITYGSFNPFNNLLTER